MGKLFVQYGKYLSSKKSSEENRGFILSNVDSIFFNRKNRRGDFFPGKTIIILRGKNIFQERLSLEPHKL
jgi:hypothetical protein